MTRPDVTVFGLGPAGRILATRLVAAGASVEAVDPHPRRRWVQSLGGWQHQLPDWLDASAIGAVSERVVLRARGRGGPSEHRLGGRYVMLDTDALQASLSLSGVRVRTERVDGDLDRLDAGGGPVVDCRGTTPLGWAAEQRGRLPRARRRLPQQTAFGCRVSPEVAAPMLAGADAVLMDWRPYHGGARWGRERASFCYQIPLADGSVLLEETCLAGDPALPTGELRRRLEVRAGRHGIDAAKLGHHLPEFVQIAMLRRPRPGLAFGAAGDQLNPISGYSVFAALHQADAVVDALLAGRAPDPSSRRLRRAALSAVLHLSGDATMALFDAFGRLDVAGQRAVLQPDAPSGPLLGALWSQWLGMPASGKLALIGATAHGVARPPQGV